MDQKYITLLQRLIQTPSISGQEDAACTMLQEWMTAEGCTTHRIGNNLWAECGRGETILLNAHIDTVKPAASYTRDPFGGECDGTIIYGLGANDDGGSVIVMLAVFMELLQAPILGKRVVLTLTAEEENSGRNGIELVLPEIGHVDWAIVGEPTSLEMAVAEISAENNDVRLSLCDDSVIVNIDKNRLKQIVENLINNARKYAKYS